MKDNSNGSTIEDVSHPDGTSPSELVDETELDEFVSGADLALIEFYTEGCGICRSMEPVLSNVSRELDIAVGTINPRDDPPLIGRFDVRKVPLFVLFVGGTPVARRDDGFLGGDELTAWIAEHSE